MTPRRRFRSLASRLVVIGVVQVALLALISVIVFVVEGPHEPADPEDVLTPATIAKLETLSATDLGPALDDLRHSRIEISIYDGKRQLVASNVDPALALPPAHHRGGPPMLGEGPPPPGPPFPHGPFGPHHRMLIPFHLPDGGGVLLARGVNAAPGIAGPLLALLGGLAIFVIGALITARSARVISPPAASSIAPTRSASSAIASTRWRIGSRACSSPRRSCSRTSRTSCARR